VLIVATAAEKLGYVSVEDYLATELTSDVKHEYLGGYLYAMAGGRVAHNLIASNVLGSLFGSLRGQSCRTFNSDMKVRIPFATHTRFYYPDVSVVCESNPPDQTYQDRPVLIVEVLSRDTRRTDEAEKKEAYLAIPTLQAYLLIEQKSARVTVFRRREQGFEAEVYSESASAIPLEFINATLPLRDIYDGVEFIPESSEYTS
jgi:Uma2 family endonuclease